MTGNLVLLYMLVLLICLPAADDEWAQLSNSPTVSTRTPYSILARPCVTTSVAIALHRFSAQHFFIPVQNFACRKLAACNFSFIACRPFASWQISESAKGAQLICTCRTSWMLSNHLISFTVGRIISTPVYKAVSPLCAFDCTRVPNLPLPPIIHMSSYYSMASSLASLHVVLDVDDCLTSRSHSAHRTHHFRSFLSPIL